MVIATLPELPVGVDNGRLSDLTDEVVLAHIAAVRVCGSLVTVDIISNFPAVDFPAGESSV